MVVPIDEENQNYYDKSFTSSKVNFQDSEQNSVENDSS